MAESSEVRIYGLANPLLLYDESDSIGRIVLRVLGVTDAGRHAVTISDSSGWLQYEDRFERFDRSDPPRLPDANLARQAAESLLRMLAAALSPVGTEWPANLRGITPLPPVFRPAGLLFIASPRGTVSDHWLFRAQAYLTASGDGRVSAPVLGGQVEVRIGDSARIIGYVGRWRALSGEILRVPMTQSASNTAEDGASAPPPRLTYALEGDGIPQYYLAPYHLTENGDDLALTSASQYSLIVNLVQEDTEDGTELTAFVSGGSGDYAFSWATYSFDDVLDVGIKDLGPGRARSLSNEVEGGPAVSSINVSLAARVVLLNVKDRATGAFKHHQEQIFSRPPEASAAGGDGWGS